MDADRFDDLLRSFILASSRRDLLAGLTSALLAASLPTLGDESAAASKKRKGKKKRRCRPNCTGKTRGSDGCRGSCGRCDGGTCTGGDCQCSGTLKFCRGACVPGCIGDAVINPLTCACCSIGPDCGTDAECCSGFCHLSGPKFCGPRQLGAACDFDAQCHGVPCPGCPRPVCRKARCACPDGLEPCGGQCVPPCTGGNAQVPGACACCRRNGQSCGGFTSCCSGTCDTSVVPSVCRGLPTDAPCDFDEQCASGACTLGFCHD